MTISPFKNLRLGDEEYPALTGVRAVGASVVFFDHFPLWPDMQLTVNVLAFFFVLSGFLIVRIYYQQMQLSLRWLTKLFRQPLCPHLSSDFLLLTIAVCLQSDSLHVHTLLTNYTLTHALFHGTRYIIQPSWSLTVEECFYFLAPLFMLLVRRFSFAASFACAALLLFAALAISELGFAFLGTPMFVLTTTFFGHFVEFFAGAWLAMLVMKLEHRDGSLRLAGSARTLAGVAGVLALAAAMVVVYRSRPLNLAAVVVLNNLLIPAPIVLLYLGLIREETALSRWCSGRLAGLLGRSSYSFYLLHTGIIRYVLLPWFPVNEHRLLCVTGGFVMTWLLSVMLFAFYEEPVNIFIRRLFHSKERWVGLQATLFPVRT